MKAKGTIVWNEKGYAFLVRDDGREDVFLRAADLCGAMHGDRVEARIFRQGKGFRGCVTCVLKRDNIRISGRYIRYKKWGVIEPVKPIPYTVIVPQGWETGARHGDMVTAILSPPKGSGRIDSIAARVDAILDMPENIKDDLRHIIIKYSLSAGFSEEALKEADEVSSVDLYKCAANRVDLRNSVLFTIDGRNARDFDDAVGMEKLNDGNFLLRVAIADVAELVRTGSVLDKEAQERGFSVYFPETCLPMLPEALSNGVLSLKPGEERLAVVAEMKLGPRGRLISTRCYEAIIRSRARLMYETASPYLEGKGGEPSMDAEVNKSLKMLNVLAGHLMRARKKAGSLDFDLPEVEIEISESGYIEDISRRPRGPAERLIEEMMLLANRAVCSYLKERNMPVLFRVHDKPAQEDIDGLVEILDDLGCPKALTGRLSQSAASGRHLNRVLNEVADAYRGHELEAFVHRHILRSLRQAEYSIVDIGHFGLGFSGYLHFTSPIRRYSDLLVHRVLKSLFRPEGVKDHEKSKFARRLKKLAPDISRKERTTNEAMMEAVKLKTASYMKRHVGETFSGIVTGILPFGFFVEISDPPVDGLVRAADIPGARISEGRKVRMGRHVISMGDKVDVLIASVDETRGYIDMKLAEDKNRRP
ncbi:MAG TPA: VacB/RNase II family 3'-5' exoribonuclease [Desulfomonilia bacterium]